MRRFIRANTPAWERAEMLAGLRALLRGRSDGAAKRRLRTAIEDDVPGWRAIPVSSARYGIAAAVRLLGLAGRRVAVPGYVCPAALTGLRAASAIVVPVDCAPESVRFDLDLLGQAAREGRIDAVLATNTYGIDQDYAALSDLGLPVIEDAAYQSGLDLVATGSVPGTRGAAGVWSFRFKALGGCGGGILLLPVGASYPAEEEPERREHWREMAREAQRFGEYALRSLLAHRIPAGVGRARLRKARALNGVRIGMLEYWDRDMSEIEAAVAHAQFVRRRVLTVRSLRNATALAACVGAEESLTPLDEGVPGPRPHFLPVLLNGREKVADFRRQMLMQRVQTEEAYPVVLGSPEELPRSHGMASRLVLVPCGAAIGEGERAIIVRALVNAADRM